MVSDPDLQARFERIRSQNYEGVRSGVRPSVSTPKPPSTVGRLPAQPQPAVEDSGPGLLSRIGNAIPDAIKQPVSRLWDIVDTPLSERAGIEVAEQRGPLDEIANFVLQEATRPTNVLFALGGAGIGARAATSGSRLVRAGGAVLSPVAPGAGAEGRVAAEIGMAVGGRVAGAAANEALPENTPEPVRIGVTIAAAAVGGLASIGAMSRIAPTAFVNPTIVRRPDGINAYMPPEGADTLYGIRPIEQGLSLGQDFKNALSQAGGRFIGIHKVDDLAAPAMNVRAESLRNVESAATRVASTQWSRVSRAFQFDKQYQITSIKGAAGESITLADLAAKLPLYVDRLSKEQLAAMEELRGTLSPFRTLYETVGGETATRGDIVEGGFYIPRGDALVEGAQDAPLQIRRPGQAATEGYRKGALYNSQAEGIAAGEQYVSPLLALHSYIRAIGNDTVDMHIASYFKNVVDPTTGKKLLETPTDRIPEALRQQYNRVNRQIAGSKNTLREQTVRLAERTAELDRIRAASGRAADRITAANVVEPINPAELREARAVLRSSITDARALSSTITRVQSMYSRANRALPPRERNIVRKLQQLNGLLDEADSLAHVVDDPARGAIERQMRGEQVSGLLAKAEELDTTISDLVEGAAEMAARATALAEKGEIYRNLDAAVREEFTNAMRMEIALTDQNLMASVSARELKRLEREQARLLQAMEAAGERRSTVEAAMKKSDDTIAKHQAELDRIKSKWESAKSQSRKTPAGQARIALPGLENATAPNALADTVNRIVNQEMKAQGKQSDVVNTLQAFNNMYRGMRATLDMSGPGIQGLVGMTNDPKGYGSAFKTSWKAWADNGETLLGDYIRDFDGLAAETGRASSELWTANNLRVGGAITEYTIGTGIDSLPATVLNKPGFKQANKAFGYFGDTLRLKWADSMLMGEMGKGRTLEDIIATGDMRRIANAANTMTGWAPNRFAGSWGDMLLFAPRFLQARLNTVGNALMGLGPNPTLDQRIALKSMIQMISVGVGVSMFAHAAFNDGEMIDIKPLNEKGEWNSNFLRIRAGDRDWSFFGTWDSLLRATVLTMEGRPHDALRGMSSGVVSNAWDMFSGTSAMGEQTWRSPSQIVEAIAENLSPFSLSDMPQNVTTLAGLDPEAVPEWLRDIAGIDTSERTRTEAIGGLFGDIFGVKSADLTPFEERDIAARDKFGAPWAELNGTQRTELKKLIPNILSDIEAQQLERAEGGDPTARAQVRRREIDDQRLENEMEALGLYLQGTYSAQQLGAAINALTRDASIRKDENDRLLGQDYAPTSPEAKVLSAFYQTYRDAEDAAGQLDWDMQEALVAGLMAEIDSGAWGDPSKMREVVEQRSKLEHPEELQWFFDLREQVRNSPYYTVQDDSVAKLQNRVDGYTGKQGSTYGDLVREINSAQLAGDNIRLIRLQSVKRQIDRDVSRQRETLRRRDPALDAALFRLGRVSRTLTVQGRRLAQ